MIAKVIKSLITFMKVKVNHLNSGGGNYRITCKSVWLKHRFS